jgi:hypothetical protein
MVLLGQGGQFSLAAPGSPYQVNAGIAAAQHSPQ